MILASEAFKKATSVEKEKILQETEEMNQQIISLIEDAVSNGKTYTSFSACKKYLTKSINNIEKTLKENGYYYQIKRSVPLGISFQIDISWEPTNPFEPQVR